MHLVHDTLTSKVLRTNFDRDRSRPAAPLDYVKYEPGFLEELDKRGYDVTTLRLYVRKKEVPKEEPPIQLHDICDRCGDNRLQHASKFPYDHEFVKKETQ